MLLLGGKKKERKEREERKVFLASFLYHFVTKALSLSPRSLNSSLLTLVLGQEHVRNPLFDGELPPRLRADQRPLDQTHLE